MKHIYYDKDTTICTDGDPAYHYLKDRVHLINGSYRLTKNPDHSYVLDKYTDIKYKK